MIDRIVGGKQIRNGAVGLEKRRQQVRIHYVKSSNTALSSQRAFVHQPAGVTPRVVPQNIHRLPTGLERYDKALILHLGPRKSLY